MGHTDNVREWRCWVANRYKLQFCTPVSACVCVCVCVCARDLAGVTLSSLRSLFSSLAVAKYDQDQCFVQKFAIITGRPFVAVTRRVIDGALIWLIWLEQGKPACIVRVWQFRRSKWWTTDGEMVDWFSTTISHVARVREVDVVGWDWLAWLKQYAVYHGPL